MVDIGLSNMKASIYLNQKLNICIIKFGFNLTGSRVPLIKNPHSALSTIRIIVVSNLIHSLYSVTQ